MNDLSALVRRVDEDRWLASRFAPEDARAKLMSLYALNHEIAHAAEAAREPGLGAIRLKWWRDGLEAISQGFLPPSHPVFEALHRITPHSAFPWQLQALVDARQADLEPAPFAAWEDMERYIDATAGLVMRLACELCGALPANESQDAFIRNAARAWGFAGLARSSAHWQLRGRSLLPKGARLGELGARARAAYEAAKPLARAMKTEAFPAFGYAALVPGYLRALRQDKIDTPLGLRHARLIVASATGAI